MEELEAFQNGGIGRIELVEQLLGEVTREQIINALSGKDAGSLSTIITIFPKVAMRYAEHEMRKDKEFLDQVIPVCDPEALYYMVSRAFNHCLTPFIFNKLISAGCEQLFRNPPELSPKAHYNKGKFRMVDWCGPDLIDLGMELSVAITPATCERLRECKNPTLTERLLKHLEARSQSFHPYKDCTTINILSVLGSCDFIPKKFCFSGYNIEKTPSNLLRSESPYFYESFRGFLMRQSEEHRTLFLQKMLEDADIKTLTDDEWKDFHASIKDAHISTDEP